MMNDNYENRLTEAMEVAGMHFDEIDSSPDSLRFTSEMGIVTYFENWTEVENWIEGSVFDDPDLEQEVDEILHPEKCEDKDITVLIVEPGMEPEVRQISTGLEALQEQVGGMIEVVYPFDDQVVPIMNEEGKLDGLPLNRGLFDDEGRLYDIIAGTFIVTGLTEDNFGSLTPEQLQKYSELYKQPQMFVKMGKDIVAVPTEPKKQIGTFELFQLRSTTETRYMQFESYDRLTRHGNTVSQSNYGQVYLGKLFSGDTLDSIYERFNLQHPADFRGHSLSVSDVIVMHQNGRDQAFYVDFIGFKQVPEFFSNSPLKKVEELLEDDYGMIDGIINNCDRRKDQEEPKKSVMETLKKNRRLRLPKQ